MGEKSEVSKEVVLYTYKDVVGESIEAAIAEANVAPQQEALRAIRQELNVNLVPDSSNEVEEIVSALYAIYIETGEVPTPEDFAAACTDAKVAQTVRDMKANPFVITPNKRSLATKVLSLVAALALVLGGMGYALASVFSEPNSTTSATSEETSYVLSLGVEAEGWDEQTSSPVIVHIVNEEADVDYHHAYNANQEYQLPVPEAGGYEISFISPINSDGSIYLLPETSVIQAVDAKTVTAGDLPFEFEPVAAGEVSADDLLYIIDQATLAIKNGDETLTGEAGLQVAERLAVNSTAHPDTDATTVLESATAAIQATQEESTAKTGSTSDSSTSSDTTSASSDTDTSSSSTSGTDSSSSSTSSDSSSSTEHTHSWIPEWTTIYHEAEYETVYHEAEYQTVYHDAEHKTTYECQCGKTFTIYSSFESHVKRSHQGTAAYTTSTTLVDAWEEKVLVKDAWEETVLVSAAWEELVISGYKCAICDETRSSSTS